MVGNQPGKPYRGIEGNKDGLRGIWFPTLATSNGSVATIGHPAIQTQ
jgi:hypothetical protein